MKHLKSVLSMGLCAAAAFATTVALRGAADRTGRQAAAGRRSVERVRVDGIAPTTGATLALARGEGTFAMPTGQVAASDLVPGQSKVCDFSADSPPADLLRETPLRDRAGLHTWLTTNGVGFNELRRAFVPSVYSETGRAKRCWKDQGGAGKVTLQVTFSLESDEKKARADRFVVRATEGSDADVALARSCLAASLLRPGFGIDAVAQGLSFARYSGTYPNVHNVVMQ